MTGTRRTEQLGTLLTSLSTVQAHLATHPGLALPFLVTVDTNDSTTNVVVQLDGTDRLSSVAGGLLTWADSLTDVTGELWRPKHGGTVHVSITGRTGGILARIYDATLWNPAVFGDLAPGAHRPVTLAQLRAWAVAVGVAA